MNQDTLGLLHTSSTLESSLELGRKCILVVDDQPSNVHSIYQIFCDEHDVLMATSGQQALDLIEKSLPDVILLDVVMPNMDGHEVCRRLKINPLTEHIPVIFVSGNKESSDEIAGLSLQAADFIHKPFVPEVVRARVKTQLHLKHKSDQLLASQDALRLAASVFTHSKDGILMLNAQGVILDANAPFKSIQGLSNDRLIGAHFNELMVARGSQIDYKDIWSELIKHHQWSGEVQRMNKLGESRAYLLNISPVLDEQSETTHYVGLYTDISEIKDYQNLLESMAKFDGLTGLPNRALMADRLNQTLVQSKRRGKSMAVCFLDLDGFKAVNDNYGHDYGDELLVGLSKRMRMALRDGDTLARIGGDEFVALVADIDVDSAYEMVLDRLLTAASKPIQVKDATLQVSASIGVALYPRDGEDPDTLTRHADQAMYVAKTSGKNRYQSYSAIKNLNEPTPPNREAEIRQAMIQGELLMHYQPKIFLQTGQVTGVEALLRWKHPKLGLLLPAEFLTGIENTDLSVEVGDWTLNEVLRQLDNWQAADLHVPISLNIDCSHLTQPNFANRLAELLQTYPKVQPSCLEIEINENHILADLAAVSAVIKSCHALNVRFALDHFGSGYASMSYLRELACDIIKIDQAYIKNLLTNANSLGVVKGIIGLANAFEREVVANGVESFEVGTMLLSLGCRDAQGYYIAQSMSATAFVNWLLSWNTGLRESKRSTFTLP